MALPVSSRSGYVSLLVLLKKNKQANKQADEKKGKKKREEDKLSHAVKSHLYFCSLSHSFSIGGFMLTS